MKKYFIIIPTLLLVYFLTLDYSKDIDVSNDNSLAVSEDVSKVEVKEPEMVSVMYNEDSLDMSIDDYVMHVLACEMPASFNVEALKAGAVAARTFYLYKSEHNASYVASVSDQCFIDDEGMKSKWGTSYQKYYDILKEVVEDTAGEFISYNGEVIESFYFSMSNGYTENIENVFSESRPYLVSVNSEWEKSLNSFEKSVTFTKNDFLNKLGLDLVDSLDIKVVSRSDSNRINKISINGVEFKGTEFRTKLGLRSTDIDISVKDNNVIITTRGYGHGVGLSQYGANEMAKLGYSYKDILKHYYTGVQISSI